MPGQTTHLTRWDWAEQLIHPLENIVERVGEYDPDNDVADFEEMLLEPLSISGGESFSAENHSGREILELLQNAQDAAGGLYTGDSSIKGQRAVYIGISDDGLLVANTGDSFDFSDPDRRKSLRILGHSETGEETIGQFGVGLTSIRGTGDAYEVWTKDPNQGGSLEWSDCWRVFCGPRTTVAAIASADTDALSSERGQEAYDRFRDQVIGGADVLDFSSETSPLESVPLSDDQIPYFTYPVAMQSWYEPPSDRSEFGGPLRSRAHELLTYGYEIGSQEKSVPHHIRSLLSDVGSFTTAVFVDYEDEDWHAIFEAITGDRPETADDKDPASEFEEQAWFDGSDTGRVTPELLLNLGHIDRLVVERLPDDKADSQSSFQDWTVFGRDRIEAQEASTLPVSGRHIEYSVGEREVDAIEVAVQLDTSSNHAHLQTPPETDSEMYSFWDAEFTDGQQYGDYEWFETPESDGSGVDADSESLANLKIDVSILLQTTNDEDELYRPHLYYPIDGVDKAFPYCIHGDFVVQQDRQSLAGSGLPRNCAVAAEAAALVGCLSEALATADDLSTKERAAIPWRLLPASLSGTRGNSDWPTPEDLVEKSSGEVADNEPIEALKAGIYRQLQLRRNVQVVSEGGSQRSIASGEGSGLDVVLHHDPTVLAGIGALYPISRCAIDEIDPRYVLERVDSPTDVSILTQSTLDYLLRWLDSGLANPPSSDLEAAYAQSVAGEAPLSSDLLDQVTTVRGTDRALRFEHLITAGVETAECYTQPATQWWTILQEWSRAIKETADVKHVIPEVPSKTGHALLNATMELGADVDTFPGSKPFAPTSGPYLLPCRQLTDESIRNDSSISVDEDHVQLVSIESHESRDNNHRQVLRPENTEITEIAPPAGTGFALYSLSKEAFKTHGGAITEARWGTRNYGGSADLYRTLLKDIADRSRELTLADLQFLKTVYDRINFEEATIDLYPFEGSYHDRDQVKKLATSRNSVDKLKTRNDARRVTVPSAFVEGSEEAAARDLRFNDQLLESWTATTVDHEVDGATETSPAPDAGQSVPPIETDRLMARLPSTVEIQPNVNNGSRSGLETQLGMLGVSVLPGVRTLLIRGDKAHPDRHENLSWDPTKWETDEPDRVRSLQMLLETQAGKTYLDLLTTPPFGPGESSYHTKHCDVKDYPRKDSSLRDELSSYGVMLTSWVWLSPSIREEMVASDLASLLKQYGARLAESVLVTGWSCNHGGGNTRHIDEFVPTFLNWQLRSVTGWEDIEWFQPPSIEGLWTDHDTWTLRCAVLDSTDGRHTAASALPRIDSSKSKVPEKVWEALGVKKLNELNATEAAYRLNALMEAAMDDIPHQDTIHREDDIPSYALPGIENIDVWKTLYGTLLGKIGSEIEDRGEHMTLAKLQFLDWVPAKDDAGDWVALSVDHLDSAVYYDSIESNWENRIAQLERGQYLLTRPEARFIKADNFESLWAATDASQKSAQYPEIDRESTTETDVEPLRQALADPEIKHGILAAAPGQKNLESNREKYDSLTDTLRLIETGNSAVDGSETAWQVTPLPTEVGLDLDNVVGAPSYAVACNGIEPEQPVELADFFMALYGGGNRDSYKLALLGHDVEGKADIRERLRATDVQQLEADLRLCTRLLGSENPIERGMLNIEADSSVKELRKSIARCLHSGDGLQSDVRENLPDDVVAVVEALCRTDKETLRGWAADIVNPTTPDSKNALRSKLVVDLPDELPSKQQIRALERLEKTLSDTRLDDQVPRFDDLLPDSSAVRITRSIHELVAGVRRLDDRAKPDVTSLDDLVDHGHQIVWAKSVLTGRGYHDLANGAADASAASDVIPEPCTWFHLAWWLDSDDRQPEATEPAQAIFETVGAFLGGENDFQRDVVKREAEESLSQAGSSSSNNIDPESIDAKLFDQTDTDLEWSPSDRSLDNSLTATLRASGGSGAQPVIEQTTNQPRVAELSVLRGGYTALCDSGVTFDEIDSRLTDLQADDNDWRTDDGWNKYKQFAGRFENNALPAPEELGTSETEYPTVAFDITDEGIVGYDVLDPTGWSVRRASDLSVSSVDIDLEPYLDPSSITPVPVEVKSVNASNPRFKFSLNQYGRAYDFVTSDGDSSSDKSNSDVPYVLFLVEVTEYVTTTDETRYTVDLVEVIVITCPADLRQLLPANLNPDENGPVIDTLILRVLRGGDLIIG